MVFVESLVVFGVLLLALVSFVDLIQFNLQLQKSIEMGAEFDQMTRDVGLVISNSQTCKKTFEEVPFRPQGTTIPRSIKPIIVAPLALNGHPIARINAPGEGVKITKLEINKIIDQRMIKKGVYRYIGVLEIEGQKSEHQKAGWQKRTFSYLVAIETDSEGRVKTCAGSLSESQLCKDWGGVYHNNTVPRCRLSK